MKRFLSFASLVLVAVMLLSVLSVGVFAEEIEAESPYRTFYTGDDYAVADGEIQFKKWGPVEDVFVKVNDEPIMANITSKLYNKGTSQTGVTVTPSEDYAIYPIVPTFDYYVAKSDTMIYIVFDMIYHPLTEGNGIGVNDTIDVWTSDYYKYFRIGFNPNDYTQQVIVSTRGHGLDNDNQKGFFYVADEDSATELWNGYNTQSPYYEYAICGATSGPTTAHRTRKYGFSIEEMKKLYLEQFGVTLTDEDFDSIFVSGGHRFREQGKVSASENQFNGTYGTLLLNEANGRTALIPDLIVFGSEFEEVETTDTAPVVDETEAPAVDDVVTEAPVTEAPAEGGCGGSVAVAGIALVAALGTCTVFVAKKKED